MVVQREFQRVGQPARCFRDIAGDESRIWAGHAIHYLEPFRCSTLA